ncbi:unnamed protein product, partial [Closterium sp. NIES-54]
MDCRSTIGSQSSLIAAAASLCLDKGQAHEWPHRGIEDFSPPPSIPHRHAPSPTTPFPLLRYPPPLLPPHVLLLEVCHTLPRSRLPPRPLLALEVWEVQLRRVQVLRVLEQVETTLGELG